MDVPINGKRARDHRNGMSIPPQVTLRNAVGVARHPAWFRSVLQDPPIGFRNLLGIAEGSSALSHQEYIDTELANLRASWDDIARLRRQRNGPLLVKGSTTVDDALSAAAAGADGIFVSNHGGRQLDSLPSSIGTLPRIVDAVGDRLDVIFDSGVRHGSDVVKALGLAPTRSPSGGAGCGGWPPRAKAGSGTSPGSTGRRSRRR